MKEQYQLRIKYVLRKYNFMQRIAENIFVLDQLTIITFSEFFYITEEIDLVNKKL